MQRAVGKLKTIERADYNLELIGMGLIKEGVLWAKTGRREPQRWRNPGKAANSREQRSGGSKAEGRGRCSQMNGAEQKAFEAIWDWLRASEGSEEENGIYLKDFIPAIPRRDWGNKQGPVKQLIVSRQKLMASWQPVCEKWASLGCDWRW